MRFLCFVAAVGCFVGSAVTSVLSAQDPNPPAGQPAVQPANNNTVEHREIRDFFQRFQETTKDETAEKLMEFYDFDAMVQAIVELADVPLPPPGQAQMAVALRNQVQTQLTTLGVTWLRHKIVSTDFDQQRTRAEVFIRNWTESHGTSREIFVLQKIGGQWKIVDYNDLSMDVSMVSFTAAVMRDASQANAPVEMLQAVRGLLASMMAAAQEDTYQSVNELDQIRGYRLPHSMEGIRWKLAAAVYTAWDAAEAIECLDKVDAFGASAPFATYVRSNAYLILERYELAAKYAQQYLDEFGADADASLVLAAALEELGRTDEAIAAYKAAVTDTPENVESLVQLITLLPVQRKEEWTPLFQNTPIPEEAFELISDSLILAEKPDVLQILIDEMAAIDPQAQLIDFYRASVLHMRGQTDAAIDALQELIRKTDEASDWLSWFEYTLCEWVSDDVSRSGSDLVSVYSQCSDKETAFEWFLSADENDDATDAVRNQINEMIKLHLQEFGDDPNAHRNIAWRAFRLKDYETAKTEFRTAISLIPDDEEHEYDLAETRSELISCYIEQDQYAQAYRELEPKEEVFSILVEELDADDPTYQQLLKLHRETDPTNPRFVIEDATEAYQSGDYEKTLDLVGASLKRSGSEQNDTWQEMPLRRLQIRALAQLKRFDEALLAARQAGVEHRDYYRAIIYAVKGDRERFENAFVLSIGDETYYAREDYDDLDEIPEGWIGDTDTTSATPDASQRAFDRDFEIRRLILLLSEPRNVDAGRVLDAASDMGLQLFAIEPQRVTTDEDEYVCQWNGNACTLAIDGCRYFVHSGNTPFLEDREGSNFLIESDEVREAYAKHNAWIAIDIYTWPQNAQAGHPIAIPPQAEKRLCELAKRLAQDVALVAIHIDTEQIAKCDEAFFDKLLSNDPITAFQNEIVEP
ncbi:tetratricopeptide repeat protein [Stieleria varia]|uniref:Tetratricopeptide repeat protein n=1 Tax=Stieleria varia TaxID=2528005 RepID=A0A5C5ZXK7_9BACT|nr:tetratricopeptide repeat protein [Stieleria varia]TWT92392.1 Tetratricopeptide repeat protein [Stieleria varia]